MALTGTFDGNRVNDSTTVTNWGRFQTGGGAPGIEASLAYQGGLTLAEQVKATTSVEGLDYTHAAGPPGHTSSSWAMNGATYPLWFVKIYVSDAFALDPIRGCEVGCGNGSSEFDRFVISGTDSVLDVYTSYPAIGGYLITAISPREADWQDALTGIEEGPVGNGGDHSAVLYFEGAIQMSSGDSKSENLATDAIDVGTGLTITGTTPDANFKNFYYYDQGGDVTTAIPQNTDNRWGVVLGSGEAVRAIGMLHLGDSGGTLTTFTDTAAVVTWPDAYITAGLFGVTFHCQNASSVYVMDSLLISEGAIDTGTNTIDTRADLIVSGTTGTFDSAATVNNFRNITLTSVCTIAGANYECLLFTPSTATVGASGITTVIRTNALANTACLQGFASGTPDLTFTDFVQTGAGHALSITAAGTYTFNNLSFTGYGADISASSAIEVTLNSASNVTINLTNTTEPTVDDDGFTGGGQVIFVSTITMTITIQNSAGTVIPGVEVGVWETDGTLVTDWISTDENGQIIDGGVVASIGPIIIKIRQSANTAQVASLVSDQLTTTANHKFNTGDGVVWDETNGSITGLTNGTTYYVEVIDADTVEMYTTAALAIAAGGGITLSSLVSNPEMNPVRYKNNTASGAIGAGNFSTTITMTEDIIVKDTI